LGANGFQEVKDHAFFSDFDWKKLENREYDPAFKPPLRSTVDLQNFNPVKKIKTKPFGNCFLRNENVLIECSFCECVFIFIQRLVKNTMTDLGMKDEHPKLDKDIENQFKGFTYVKE